MNDKRMLFLAVVCLLSAANIRGQETYSHLWWADGWRGHSVDGGKTLHIQTDHYGASIAVEKPDITHLGAIANPTSYAKAAAQSNLVINKLPAAALRLSIRVGPKRYICQSAAGQQDDEANYPVRLIESGRYVQRIDLLHLLFSDADNDFLAGEGRLEIIAWPERMQIVLEWIPEIECPDTDLDIALTQNGHELHAMKHLDLLGSGEKATLVFSWPEELQEEEPLPADKVIVTDITDDRLPVTYDPNRAWYCIDLPEKAWDIATEPDRLDRYPLRLTNPTSHPVTYNLLFAFDESFPGVTGLCPILRDTQGNPTGIPIQISKNWHRREERRLLYEGPWFHGFTQITVPADVTWTGELALCYARWGGIPAASHAQLCLIGWGVNQRWDQAAIGSWGESICYDPDINLNRSMIDDVRPLMVTGMNNGIWEWTCNVGGGDFLVYLDERRQRQYLTRVKTAYLSSGPNLTETVYCGVTADGHIEARITVSTPRCEDINRAYHRVRYDVLSPTPFSRLAFYQVGADLYNDHQFSTLARGNTEGLLEEWPTEQGGKRYLCKDIPCDGDTPWFSMHGGIRSAAHPKGAWANRGLVVRAWKARLGGRDIPFPYISSYGTENGPPSANLELTAPPGLTQLEAGDFVEAELELLIVPVSANAYYGPNQALLEDLKLYANTWRPIHRLARGNRLEFEIETGSIMRAYPPKILADDLGTASVMISGGVGYVPITIAGLHSPVGYSLECNGAMVNQQVNGNDYWQTDFDADSNTWSRTYNLPFDTPSGDVGKWQVRLYRP